MAPCFLITQIGQKKSCMILPFFVEGIIQKQPVANNNKQNKLNRSIQGNSY